ncbi:hypothetical protein ABZ876_08300 [Streptomyces sp. NPDC046931]|uniref:hypothetical protein n=1 Tax=Streptomyces sp. NPDC046931 TaxID=3154806 RepID=UPI0033D919A1
MSSWFEERRADKAEDAKQRRLDEDHRAKLRREERRADREEQREVKAQKRRDKAQRRQARAARREKQLTPGNVYRKGTLALVAASALASLPAQVMHFVRVSLMLLPLPFALEGAAWVMAAGVAYADERKLPGWVRWLLRALSMGAAGYAAHINYTYGAQTNASVAWGLAGVTVMGPLVFEIRQWVSTLSAAAVDPKKRAEAKARAKHERRRYSHHKDVVKLAWKLVSAAPYGELAFEEAFASAWEIKHGTRTPGMTPELHGQAHASRKALAAALDAANGSPISTRGRLLELLHPAPVSSLQAPGSSQATSQIPPGSERASNGAQKTSAKSPRMKPVPPVRRKGDTAPYHQAAKVAAAHTARKHTVNGHHH